MAHRLFGVGACSHTFVSNTVSNVFFTHHVDRKEGLKIGPATGQQSQPDRTKQAQELMRALDSSALLEQERLIKADLEKRGLEHTGETIDVLVRHLAGYQLAVAFEEIYRLIFGSQIYILKRANETRVLTGASVEEIRRLCFLRSLNGTSTSICHSCSIEGFCSGPARTILSQHLGWSFSVGSSEWARENTNRCESILLSLGDFER